MPRRRGSKAVIALTPRGGGVVRAAVAATAALIGWSEQLAAQPPPPPEKKASTPVEAAKTPAPDLKPFDLTYVPAQTKSLIAFRPAAILRMEGMRDHREAFQFKLPTPVKPEAIEQVVFCEIPQPRAGRGGRTDSSMGPSCLMIRFAEDIEWQGAIRDLVKDSMGIKVSFEGKDYYKQKAPEGHPAHASEPVWCCYFPDARTFVEADEGSLRAVLRQSARELPALVRCRSWEEVRCGVAAVAIDADDVEGGRDSTSSAFLELLQEVFPRESRRLRRIHCGIDCHEMLRIRISEDHGNAEAAAAERGRFLDEDPSRLLPREFGDELVADSRVQVTVRCLTELMRNCWIDCDGPTLEIASRCKLHFTELFVLASDRKSAPANDDKPSAAKPVTSTPDK